MRYPKFNNVEVRDELGVSRVGEDTLLLASVAAQLEPEFTLDVGTGTGFIAIYLASLGRAVEGVDIDPRAVACARENAELSRVEVSFSKADLLERSLGPYNLIVFNPPYGGRGRGVWCQAIRIAKSLFPKDNPILSFLTYPFVKRGRRQLLRTLLRETPSKLRVGGALLLLVDRRELDLLAGMDHECLGSLGRQLVVRVAP